MSEIVTWAWSEEKQKMVHIDDVDVHNGLNCRCICTKCKKPLVARQGGKNAHSFAHQSEDGMCVGAGESSIHYLAKQIISEEFYQNSKETALNYYLRFVEKDADNSVFQIPEYKY